MTITAETARPAMRRGGQVHLPVFGQSHVPHDLRRFRPIAALLRWRGFPYAFQLLALATLVSLMLLAWGDHAPPGVPDKLYAKSHLATLVVWALWWPSMVWIAVLLGRAWCMVCPLELVSNAAERLGRIVGLRGRSPGRWLRSGIAIAGAYLLLQVLVAGMHIHRVPAYTALMLLALLGTAVLLGLTHRDRAFCRVACPVGLLLGTYGRGGALAVRPIDRALCRTCRTKDCVRADRRHRWHARSCPSLLNPARLRSNRDCLLCGHCIAACPHKNLTLLLRRPFGAADERESNVAWPVLAFVVIVSGFVTYELCTEWHTAKAIFLWVPSHFATALGLAANNGWIKAGWTLGVFPVMLWLTLAAITPTATGIRLVDRARRLTLPIAIVVAGGHMAKGVAKIASWAGYLPAAVRDPSGEATAIAIATGLQPAPAPSLSAPAIAAIAVALVGTATALAIREARLADPDHGHRLRRPLLILGLMFAAIAFGWSLPA